MSNLTENYKTKDLGECAALIVAKQRLADIEREGRVCWFVFDDREECEKLASQFFFGELLLNAREYYEAMVRVKNRIFSRA
jgi:hypothetical protein